MPGSIRILQPVGDDRVASAHRLADRVVGVYGIIGEQGADRRGVVRSPRVDVRVEPPLHVLVGHAATLTESFAGPNAALT